ncbi:MAG: polynucleotide adenylyltransferase [Clostridia bacterium]|nr:polynucleotide adenylyltransferase [Clostridia bacterium]
MELSIAASVPANVRAVMQALERAEHRGYLVGGCLRDLLLGKVPHDFDLTTDATPAEMVEIFSDFRVIPTGLKHGTLTVLSDGQPVEVTTHRVDGEYRDSRRPESVCFTRRLADDLSRRDFTVNAMAWSEATGLVDLFGGQEDLRRGVIRAVGDPVARFTEDALRILRAFRFAAQLDFEIEESTLLGARDTREGLTRISAERVFSEITRLLTSTAAVRGINALFAAQCEKQVFSDTVLCLEGIEALQALPANAALRLAFLLREQSADAAEKLCRRLRASNAFTDEVTGVLRALGEGLPDDLYAARRFVSTFWQSWQGALTLRRAMGDDIEQTQLLCKRVAKNGTAIAIRALAVSGKELQDATGVRPDQTGVLLSRLQDLCWQEPSRNKKSVLMELASEICQREKGFL